MQLLKEYIPIFYIPRLQFTKENSSLVGYMIRNSYYKELPDLERADLFGF